MVGDGSYLMMNSEIVTAVCEGIKMTIVIVDNHGYQCILALQRAVGVTDFGNELRFRDQKSQNLTGEYIPVDFCKHAESMGARAVLAQTADQVRQALGEARATSGVTVVVVPVDPAKRMPGLGTWWDVPVAEISSIQKVTLARNHYESAKANQRPVYSHENRHRSRK
jgi:3D-(3,5/4)-trihydroxycyclohexane-1,2-dione acylhydrolase (decyclizing)